MTTPIDQRDSQSTISFLSAILPSRGVYTALELPRGRHARFENIEELAAHIRTSKAEAVYHACAAFKDGTNRRAENVRAVKAFWLDLDCGEAKAAEGKGYFTQSDAANALRIFCKSLSLPLPMVVNSGHGLHIYWLLSAEITPDDWKPVALNLKSLTNSYGLLADASRTSDIASVLRPVGSYNRKDGHERLVELSRGASPVDFEQFKASIEAASERLGVHKASPRLTNREQTEDVAKRVNPNDFSIEQVACALQKINPDCPYPEWARIGMVLADAFGEDARALFHKWSCGELTGGTK